MTMSLLFKAKPENGHQSVFKPGEKGIKWLGLEVLRLAAGEKWEGKVGANEEAGFVILGGKASVAVNGKSEGSFENIGGRNDMFAGLPTTLYAPRGSSVSVKAASKLEIAIAKAPCDVDLPVRLVKPEDVKVVSAGMANWRRDVRMLIPPGSPISQRMIIGETINPPGNWSGIPPHKHDTITAVENILEEWYFFKVSPANGYGLQIMDHDGEERAHIIHSDDVAVMLGGYHPTAAAPGVTVGYLWVLSGDDKAYNITTDPRFSWVPSAEAVLHELKH
jgi:5-deoxy-glucuronate isomerase